MSQVTFPFSQTNGSGFVLIDVQLVQYSVFSHVSAQAPARDLEFKKSLAAYTLKSPALSKRLDFIIHMDLLRRGGS